MLELKNVNSLQPLSVLITHGDKRREFSIGEIVSKRNKLELDPVRQFTLLNAYIDHRGPAFKDRLMDLYMTADDVIMEQTLVPGIKPMPVKVFHDVLDMFNVKDMASFLKYDARIVVPDTLGDSFDTQIESDGLGSRVQTYTKTDYMELATTTTIIKAILPLIGHYAEVKTNIIRPSLKEYVLMSLYNSHPIMVTPGMVKLLGICGRLYSQLGPSSDAARVLVIEKQVPESEIPMFVLGQVVLQKICVGVILGDNGDKNIITRVYNFIKNKLKPKTGTSNRIKDKIVLADPDSGTKESMLECYRISSEVSPGTEVELNWSVSNIEEMLADMDVSYTRENLRLAKRTFKVTRDTASIAPETVTMLSYVMKDIIDPRGLDYLTIDSMYNIMVVAYLYLWDSGHRELAIFLASIPDENITTGVIINSGLLKNTRIPDELMTALDMYYPNMRIIGKDKVVNVAVGGVSDLTTRLFRYRWISIAPDTHMESVYGSGNKRTLPDDLKIKLIRLLITIEENRNEST